MCTACTVLPSDHSGVNRALAVCDLWNAVGGGSRKCAEADEKSKLAAAARAAAALTPDPHLRSHARVRAQTLNSLRAAA